MHTEDSPVDRTPDLVAKIRALREQADRQMNQFTSVDDYDVRRVTGRKPKADTSEVLRPASTKKKQARKTEQASLDFQSASVESSTHDGEGA